ncbi:hypothetical protein MASR1M107_12280 [Ignavibacteriales bacterium]
MPGRFMVALLFLFISSTLSAQWSSDPAANFRIADTMGNQHLPKLAISSDGSSFVSWFESGSGSYRVYLQKLNSEGKKQWGEQGLLISSHPQNSYLMDYSLTTDSKNNAIVAFTDVRTGNLGVFVYKISSAGKFVWGADGIQLSKGSASVSNPVCAVASDGSVVIAWNSSDSLETICIQKITADGKKAWGDAPLTYSSAIEGESYLNPQLVASDKGSVIMVHSNATGKFPGQSVRLAAQKFNAKGVAEWKKGGVMIQSIGYVMKFSVPFVASDGANGALVAWHDERDLTNIQGGFVQRVNSNGTLSFPANGAEVSSKQGFNKYHPVACRLSSTNEVIVFWRMSTASQVEDGIFAQKFDAKGKKMWGDEGVELVPVGIAKYIHYDVVATAKSASLFYISSDFTGFKSVVNGLTLTTNGKKDWAGPFEVSSITSEKNRISSRLDKTNSAIVVWGDNRTGKELVYGQKIKDSAKSGKK